MQQCWCNLAVRQQGEGWTQAVSILFGWRTFCRWTRRTWMARASWVSWLEAHHNAIWFAGNAARLCVGVLPHVAKRPCRRALLTKGGETVSARSSEAVPNAQSWCGLLTRIYTRVAAMIHMFVPCAAKRELQRQTARSRVPHRIVICSGGSCCSSTNLRYLLPTSWFTPLIVFL